MKISISLTEDGKMPPQLRRYGVIEMEFSDLGPGRTFMRDDKTFKVKTCDPQPTFYLWVTTADIDAGLFPEMKLPGPSASLP